MSFDKHTKKYPERPQQKGRPKSSHSSGGKGKPFFELVTGIKADARKVKLPEYKLAPGGVTAGHNNPSLRAFLHEHRLNFVPIRQWGGKTWVNV